MQETEIQDTSKMSQVQWNSSTEKHVWSQDEQQDAQGEHKKNISYINEESLGLPFLFLQLIEELHFLPVSCLHHSSQLVHFGLHLQHVLIRKRNKTKIY